MAAAPQIDPDFPGAAPVADAPDPDFPGAAPVSQAPVVPDPDYPGASHVPSQAEQSFQTWKQLDEAQQARSLPQKAGDMVGGFFKGGWNTVKDLPRLGTAALNPAITMAASPVLGVAGASLLANRVSPPNPALIPSVAETAYQLPSGLLKAGVDSLKFANPITSPVTKWLYDKATEAVSPPNVAASQKDEAQQKRFLDYLSKNNVPGYAPPNPGSAIQTANAALSTGTLNPTDEAITNQSTGGVAPDPHLVNALSTAAMAIPFEGAAAVAEGSAASKAATLKKAMTSAMEKAQAPVAATTPVEAAATAAKSTDAVNEALHNAGETEAIPAAPGEVPPIIKAPVIPTEITPAVPIPSQAGFGNGIVPSVGETLGQGISAAGSVAKIPQKFLNWASEKGHISDVEISPWLKYYALNHLPGVGHAALAAISVVKALEKTGQMSEGLGDLMERLATADKTDPAGIWANAAENAPAGHWTKALVKNPAVQVALKGGTLAGGYIKGAAVGAGMGALMGVASGESPEGIGENAGQMSFFGGAHGAMSAPQAKIFDANIGGAAKVVTDHLENGGSQATLQLVPASDILRTANLKAVLPDTTVKFRTAQDAGSPFAPSGVAKGNAGWYDRANKTIWIDPTKRAPGGTLLHEAFHPIFDELVAQRPDIKATLDQALKNDVSAGPEGKTVDHFKLDYANRISDGDPYTAADYIKTQDAANPDWGYSEMLSEAASHALDGKDLLQAMQGKDVQQSATQEALQGVQGWLSDNGVDLQRRQDTGTIFPDFKGSFNDPALRQLTYRLLKAQRDTVYNKAPVEAPEVKLTSADMGGPKAPWYNVTDKHGNPKAINPYGERVVDPKTGKESIKVYPPSELRRRQKTEEDALDKYFPDKTLVTKMPAGLMEDPAITPWTKQSIKTSFDSIANGEKISFWNHGIAGGKSATDRLSFAKRASRDLGNVPVSYQRAWSRGVEKTSKGNYIDRMQSEEAEDQLLAQMATKGDLDLWGGDRAKAKADLNTLKSNHVAGLTGDASGLGTAKRDVLNKLLKKTFRSFRLDRREGMTPEPSEAPVANWEKVKANLSPAAEPAKRLIELTGPDGKKYAAKYDGLQDDFKGGPPWIQVTPQVDLPGATGAKSTTYAHSLLKKGYTLPQDLLDEVKAALGKPSKVEKTPDYAKLDAEWAAKQAKKSKGNFSPSADENIREQAAEYTKAAGLTAKPHTDFARLNEDLGKRVADAYEAAPHISDDPKVKASYQALAKETKAQWDFLTQKGVTFEPWTKEGQPYANSSEMRADIQQNKHLYFFLTENEYGQTPKTKDKLQSLQNALTKKYPGQLVSELPDHEFNMGGLVWDLSRRSGHHSGRATVGGLGLWNRPVSKLKEDFGGGPSYEETIDHPMLAPTDDPKAPVVNDMFRAVHDYFGHAKEGYEFDPRGKYNAYLAHSKMFSKAAIPALTAETMGQNSWVNKKWEEKLSSKQFSPGEDKIHKAAIRTGRGKVYTGDWHGEAIADAEDSGESLHDAERGYVTTSGRFVSQKEAGRLFPDEAVVSTENIQGKKVQFSPATLQENSSSPEAANPPQPMQFSPPNTNVLEKDPNAAQKATALPDELTQESLNPKQTFSPAQPESLSSAATAGNYAPPIEGKKPKKGTFSPSDDGEQVPYDSLPDETKSDIEYHLSTDGKGISGLDEEDTKGNLRGLADEPTVKTGTAPASSISMSSHRAISKETVRRYVERLKSGESPPPVVVERTEKGLHLLEGGHRLVAAKEVGARIPYADITGLKNADWKKWANDEPGHGMPTVEEAMTSEDRKTALAEALKSKDWKTVAALRKAAKAR
jgi:hypothetical protein